MSHESLLCRRHLRISGRRHGIGGWRSRQCNIGGAHRRRSTVNVPILSEQLQAELVEVLVDNLCWKHDNLLLEPENSNVTGWLTLVNEIVYKVSYLQK